MPRGTELAVRQLSFDYGDIPAADSKALERHATAIVGTLDKVRRTTVDGLLALGKEFAAAQGRLSNHGNGTFGKWCAERCGISRMTAQRYLQVFETFKDCNNLLQTFDPSALYILSSNACPQEATDEALKAAKAGEPITHKRAKEIVKGWTAREDEAGEEPETDEEESDDDPIGWEPMECLRSLRREVKRWAEVCPVSDLEWIQKSLRDIAEQLERKKNAVET